MAKYTMLFGELMNETDAAYPAAFDKIPDIYEGVTFKDLFLERYADREIGFETDGLFLIKWNARADVVVSYYLDKIKVYNDLKEKGFGDTSTEFTEEKTYLNPILNDGKLPNTNVNAGFTREHGGENSRNYFDRSIAAYREIPNVYNDLLREFETLFMQVY